MPEVKDIIAERDTTHGDYDKDAKVFTELYNIVFDKQEPTLTDPQFHALLMMLVKIARICSGNPNFEDHWRDIEGYAKLAADRCPKNKRVPPDDNCAAATALPDGVVSVAHCVLCHTNLLGDGYGHTCKSDLVFTGIKPPPPVASSKPHKLTSIESPFQAAKYFCFDCESYVSPGLAMSGCPGNMRKAAEAAKAQSAEAQRRTCNLCGRWLDSADLSSRCGAGRGCSR